MSDIGKQIAKMRKNKGYTQEALAEILDISPQSISKWENGHSLPETALLPTLSRLFGCSIDDILMPQNKNDTNILHIEFAKQTENIIKKVEGMLMNNRHIGFSDEQILRALCNAYGSIENCTIHRTGIIKSGRTVNTKISITTPIGEVKLIEKLMFRGDKRHCAHMNVS